MGERQGHKHRRKLVRAGILLFFFVLLPLVLLWRAGLLDSTPFVQTEGSPEGPPYEYVGVLHCHSTLSDGGRSVPEIASIADRLGLDFLFITDHDTLEGLPLEGKYGTCRVLVGMEISTAQGQLLALGIPETEYRLGGEGDEAVEQVKALGGLSVIAHPVSDRFSWTAPEWVRADGIEVLNGDTAWRNAPYFKILPVIPVYLMNPSRALLYSMSHPRDALRLWDRYLESGSMIALAGADSHGRIPFLRWSIPFPRYEDSLPLFPVHVLTEEELSGPLERDRRVILEALRRGSAYLSVNPIGSATGFRFRAGPEGSRETVGMGGSLSCRKPVRFRTEVPAASNVRLVLLRNGTPIAEAKGKHLEHVSAEPGTYRVEVYPLTSTKWAGRIPWIISNPIRVNLEPRPLSVPPLFPCDEGDMIESFDIKDRIAFRLEAEPRTLAETGPAVLASPGASGSGSCLLLPFRIPSTREHSEALFWALADRSSRNLEGCEGISFHVRSDRRLRLKLQVRDEDPEGQEGSEWHSATFIATPEWRCVSIPFSRFRCVSRGIDARLDLKKVKGVFFIGDMTVLKPGVSGRVWLDEVRAYRQSLGG